MGCRNDYMYGSEHDDKRNREINIRAEDERLRKAAGIKSPDPSWDMSWSGPKKDQGIINERDGARLRLDQVTHMLCEVLTGLQQQECGTGWLSAEVQGWWQTHQAWDIEREAKEKEEQKQAALDKLTQRERDILGIG